MATAPENVNAPGLLDVHLYINPETMEVEGVYAYSFMGIAVRDNSDWEPATREETRIDEFTRFINYKIDWSVDYEPASSVPEGEDFPEHEIVEAYDNDTLTWEMVKKYCVLVHDETGRNPEAMGK